MAVGNTRTEKALRRVLASEGFSLNRPREWGETGVDIIAKRGDGDVLHIEVIGYKAQGPTRTKDFCEAFFRTISRLNEGATRCVLALPREFQRGMRQRARHYGIAWNGLGAAFPELSLWFVDCRDADNPSYEESTWLEWAGG